MLSVIDLHKSYRGAEGAIGAVEGVSFDVAEGTMFGILGPSGCGKTTLLRCIAGLEVPEGGEIRIGGGTVFSHSRAINVASEARAVSFVFQSYAIWPHLSVFENAAFPLRVRGARTATIEEEVERVLESVGLATLRGRPATTLSGGQQQRLALARAIVARPQLLLLDEPLSNLDEPLRERMRLELKRLQREYGVSTVFVTHDQREALSLADAVAVMDRGRISQIDAPRAIYERPANVQVAEFVGSMNFVRARTTGRRNLLGHQILLCAWGEVAVRGELLPPDQEVTLGVRPERVRVVLGDSAGANVFRGEVQNVLYYGSHQEVALAVGESSITVALPARTDLMTGQTLVISVDAGDINVLTRRAVEPKKDRILAA